MSLEAWEFDKETPETAFLGGVVSVATDQLTMTLQTHFKQRMSYGAVIEADIYYIEKDDIIGSIKKRMRENWFGVQMDEEALEKLLLKETITLNEIKDCQKVEEMIRKHLLGDVILTPGEEEKLYDILQKYILDIKWHIDAAFVKAYKLEGGQRLISSCYTYITNAAIAVVMGEYCLVMFYGCNE